MAPARGFAALVALVAVALLLPAAAYAAQRYASPASNKTSGTCPESDPCHVEHAIEGAAANDEVIVLPGNHSVTSSINADDPLTIHGVEGQPRPRLVGQPSLSMNLLRLAAPSDQISLHHLELEHLGTGGVALHVYVTVVASDLVVIHPLNGAIAFFAESNSNVLLRDSVVRATGSNATGVQGAGTLNLRNVTAIAPGTNSHAVRANGSCSPPMTCTPLPGTVIAKNVIARGGGADLHAVTNASTAPAKVNVSYSNFRPAKTSTSGPAASVNDEGNNQSADPVFVDFTGGDFHQAAGSPTIDAGTSDPQNGPTDFDGDGRALGAAPDIGADEFVPPRPPPNGDGGGQDPIAPVAKDLAAKPNRFRAARSGASITAKAPIGTRITYSLTEIARTIFTVERAAPGRKVKGKCVKPKRSNRKRKKCTRYVRQGGSFDHQGATGPNSFRFTGRLNNKKLKPGSYRLVGVPIDVAGNVGKAVRTKFRIVK